MDNKPFRSSEYLPESRRMIYCPFQQAQRKKGSFEKLASKKAQKEGVKDLKDGLHGPGLKVTDIFSPHISSTKLLSSRT